MMDIKCKRCGEAFVAHVQKQWAAIICGEMTKCSGSRCPDGKGSFVIAEFRLRLNAAPPRDASAGK